MLHRYCRRFSLSALGGGEGGGARLGTARLGKNVRELEEFRASFEARFARHLRMRHFLNAINNIPSC
jgi:hypothetical protein